MTLVDFLRVRLDEDAAEIAKQPDGEGEPGGIGIWASGDALSNTEYLILSKRRALAEVEAKRRLIDSLLREGDHLYEDEFRLLALPYADHPDYDSLWRP